MKGKKLNYLIPVLLLVIAILFPLVVSNGYFLNVLLMAYIWTIAVCGMNLIAGYTGQLSLAQAGFFGIGAYTYGLLTLKAQVDFLPALLFAIILTGVIGYAVGLISLRTKGHYFSIFSLCVGVILALVLEKWESLTEGVRGLIGIPTPSIGSFVFESYESQYYLVLFFLVLTMVVSRMIIFSLVGRTFQSVRNSEELAEALGVNVMRSKMTAFVLSTMFAGLAGALYSASIRFIGPDISMIDHTFDMLLYLLVGGLGTFWGPLVGTLLVSILTQSMQFLQEYRMVIFGPLLVLLIMFLPQGIMGAIAKRQIHKKMNRIESQNSPTVEKREIGIVRGEVDAQG